MSEAEIYNVWVVNSINQDQKKLEVCATSVEEAKFFARCLASTPGKQSISEWYAGAVTDSRGNSVSVLPVSEEALSVARVICANLGVKRDEGKVQSTAWIIEQMAAS